MCSFLGLPRGKPQGAQAQPLVVPSAAKAGEATLEEGLETTEDTSALMQIYPNKPSTRHSGNTGEAVAQQVSSTQHLGRVWTSHGFTALVPGREMP